MKNVTKQTKKKIVSFHPLLYYKLSLIQFLMVEIVLISIVVYSASLEQMTIVLLFCVLAAGYFIYQFFVIAFPLVRHLKAVNKEPKLKFSFLAKKTEIEKIEEKTDKLVISNEDILLVFETKKSFYLILARKSGFVVDKDGFLVSTPSAFKNHLKANKIQSR